jgi:hypothetical protein
MITPKITVKHPVSDTAYLAKVLDQFKGRRVDNGVLTGTGAHPSSESGATVASIAAWNEWGTPRIPPRPFMRLSYEAFKKDTAFLIKALKSTVFAKNGKYIRKNADVKGFFDVCGLKIQSLMVKQIDSNMPPENAPSTIAAKGSDHTLFDKGSLKKSLSYAVRNN